MRFSVERAESDRTMKDHSLGPAPAPAPAPWPDQSRQRHSALVLRIYTAWMRLVFFYYCYSH